MFILIDPEIFLRRVSLPLSIHSGVMYHKVSPADKLMEAFKGSQLSSRTFGTDKNTIILSTKKRYIMLHNITSRYNVTYITSLHITSHYISFGRDENTIFPPLPP